MMNHLKQFCCWEQMLGIPVTRGLLNPGGDTASVLTKMGPLLVCWLHTRNTGWLAVVTGTMLGVTRLECTGLVSLGMATLPGTALLILLNGLVRIVLMLLGTML